MSSRAKRNKYGLSPYCQWILIGMLLGWRVIVSKTHRRMYQLEKDGEILPKEFIAAAVVNRLVDKYICFTEDKKGFRLNNCGFDFAVDKVKGIGFTLLKD